MAGRSSCVVRCIFCIFLCALETRIIEDPTAATAVQATLPVLQPSLNKNSQQNQIELYEERIRHSLLQPEKCLAWRTWSGPKMLLCCCACHSACLTIRPNASWPKWQFD